MAYLELEPPPELRPWVLALWCFEVRADAGVVEHRIPLTGGLLLSLGRQGGPLLIGPRIEPLVVPVRGGEVFWGAHLWPGAAGSLLHLPAGSLRGEIGPAERWIDPAWCRRLAEAAGDGGEVLPRLADALAALVPAAGPLDGVVTRAVAEIVRAHGQMPLGELARAVALSPRQLRRRFRTAVGLSPKELTRVRRLRAVAAAAALDDRSWVDRLEDGGYADQPHLVREFRSLLGIAPGAFERHARRIDHRLVDP
jgi:AraC-like DNA-binding protein